MTKNINKEVESALRWFATEYYFLNNLSKKLQDIGKDETLKNAEKKLQKALQLSRYIGRAENVADRKLTRVKEDLSTLSSINKPEIAEIIMIIEVPEKELIKGSSQYLGSLKEGIQHLRVLLKEKEKHPEIKELDEQFKREERSLVEEIKNLEHWLIALELGLKQISRRQFLKKTGTAAIGAAAAGIGYYASRKYRVFHRFSGLFDNLFFSNKEVHKLDKKGVFITIDDGPNFGSFSSFLKYFNERKIVVTFFFIGKGLQVALENREYKEMLIFAIKKGFIIGNHSYSHTPFSQLDQIDIYEEIRKTDELINQLYKLAGVERTVKLFRFPYGDRPKFLDRSKVYAILEKLNYEIWFWSKDTMDWEPHRTVNKVLASINTLDDGDIILIHQQSKTVREFLDPICKKIEEKGISFGNYLV